MIHCALLGFMIDKDSCFATGENPLCRKCRGEEETPATLPHGKRKARKRCKCGRGFLPKCNRQKFCETCQEVNERNQNRIRKARSRRKETDSKPISGGFLSA